MRKDNVLWSIFQILFCVDVTTYILVQIYRILTAQVAAYFLGTIYLLKFCFRYLGIYVLEMFDLYWHFHCSGCPKLMQHYRNVLCAIIFMLLLQDSCLIRKAIRSANRTD